MVVIAGLVLALAAACGGVPDELAPVQVAGARGPFTSSQIKPPAAGRPALGPPTASAKRVAAQQAYFAQLKKGQRPDKAKLLGPTAAPLSAGVRDLRAGVLPLLVLQARAGQTLRIETRQLSRGADPVLHLWSPKLGRQVAFDDDGGDQAGASQLRYTPSQGGALVLLLRAYSAQDGGRCDLLVDGQRRLRDAVFGGAAVPVAAGRTLHAVLLNDGQGDEPWPPSARAAVDPLLLLIDPRSGALLGLDDDSGVELGARLASGPAAALAMVGAYRAGDDGSARLVVNDAPTADTDRDGLGDGLERAICTCASAAHAACGFACSAAATPQDSDGDGLSDAEELLGVHHASFPQLLPRWGADPRHKDLFVELDLASWVDHKKRPPVRHFGRTMTTADAHASARVFAALTAMGNPNGADGIRLHLDLGHACGALPLGLDPVCGAMCALGPDGVRRCGQNAYGGDANNKRANLAPGRLHRFHLAVSDCLVAGSGPIVADTLEFDCDRHTAMVHELGHNLGLARHYGTFTTGGGNCKPNYPSLMNYAYSDRFNGGREVRFSSGALVGAGDLNLRALNETTPLGGATADVGWLATRPFFFDLYDCVSPGRGCKVDFNRDGRLDPSVRANLSPMPNYGWICEGAHGNALDSENVGELQVNGGPAAAEAPRQRAGGKAAPALYVVAPASATASGKARLQLSYTFEAYAGWSAWQPLAGLDLPAGAQPAAAAVGGAGVGQRLMVVAAVAADRPLRYLELDQLGQPSAWSTVPGQPSGLRARDVSLARVGGDVVLLVRDDAPAGGDRVYLARRGPTGWTGSFTLVRAQGVPLRSTVTPALAAAPDGRLYVVTGDPDPAVGGGPPGRLHLYSQAPNQPDSAVDLRDEELYGLAFADGAPDHEHVLWARPAMAAVPHLDGKGQPLSGGRGYLAIWWNRGTRTRYLWTWGRLDSKGAAFTLGRWHHYEAWGYTDAIIGSGPALALRQGGRLAALISQADRFVAKVRHVPHADGIPATAVTFRDHDDRPAMRQSLCPSLNWECKQRCKDLSLPCGKQTKPTSLTTVQCKLPRWPTGAGP